ncbi:MAG: cell division protein FtsX [Flavobacteriaceae bacterium]|nr:cell division protein FtsX [Flavobacteriaceae bacterium]
MQQLAEEKFNKRRLISTYLSLVVSISLVLFLTGLLGILLLNSKKVADHFKEQIAMTIYTKDNAKEIELKQLQKTLNLNLATKKVTFVSKEEASMRHSNEIGEDFIEFLGYNPLMNSFDVYFKASYLSPAMVSKMSKDIQLYSYVSEVIYDQPLLDLLDENIKKIKFGMIITFCLFILVAVLLINSSIRLSIYSKRLVIKTMQLVGATKSFIRIPFIKTHLFMGLTGAFIAIFGLATVFYEMDRYFPELKIFENPIEPTLIFVAVLTMGLGITFISTFFATQRYLNLKSDSVY